MNESSPCLFCRIVAGETPAWRIWDDARHVAFLTPFPNTVGFSVVIPKAHLPSYWAHVAEDDLVALVRATKHVARCIDEALGTARTAMIAEGMGIDHLHTKLVPMHGIAAGPWKAVNSTKRDVYERYEGFVASHDGPRAPDAELEATAELIRAVARSARSA
jgi:diadenosine tetraphosphate (Ap4A) HIT family hydrolase